MILDPQLVLIYQSLNEQDELMKHEVEKIHPQVRTRQTHQQHRRMRMDDLLSSVSSPSFSPPPGWSVLAAPRRTA